MKKTYSISIVAISTFLLVVMASNLVMGSIVDISSSGSLKMQKMNNDTVEILPDVVDNVAVFVESTKTPLLVYRINQPEASVLFGAVGDETLEVLLSNDLPVAGFQFNIEGLTITGVEAGDVVPEDWTIYFSATTVLGFSMQGTTIPAGSGVLVDVSFTGDGEACLDNVILSDSSGNALDVSVGGCVDAGDDVSDDDVGDVIELPKRPLRLRRDKLRIVKRTLRLRTDMR